MAQIIAVITINAPAAAARGLRRFGLDPQRSADVWSEFVLGGWTALAKRFGEDAPQPPSPRKRAVATKRNTTAKR